jgi:hypothetical protein
MKLVNSLVGKLEKKELAKNVTAVVLCEDTHGDIDNIFGSIPNFMRFFPEEVLIRDWPLWKMVGDVDMERAAYLLSIDRIREEML